MLKYLCSLAALCWLVSPSLAEDGDDTLRFYLKQSPFVVVGELQSASGGESTEVGIAWYRCQFAVNTVLKGTVDAAKPIDLSMYRFEMEPGDQTLTLEKGRKFILFLKKTRTNQDEWQGDWQTVDPWFGILPYNSLMAKSLARLAAAGNADPAVVPPTSASAPRQTGKLIGRFLFDGVPPERKPLNIPTVRLTRDGREFKEPDFAHYSQLKLTDDTLIVGPDRGVQNVLVAITDKTVPVPPVPPVRRLPAPAVLTFKNGRLEPHLLAWWAPSRDLQIQNLDKTSFNLRWDSAAGNQINHLMTPNLAFLYRARPERIPTHVKSDVFYWLQPAVLFPSPHPYFAVTDAEGYFAMPDLPVGEWEFRAWHERCGWIKTEAWPQGLVKLKIDEGQTDLGTIKLAPAVFDTRSKGTQPPETRPAQSETERPGWRILGEKRRAANERGGATEWVGKWQLRLPAGFQYDVTLGKTDDGLLKLDCPTKITLLGTFAFSKNQLQLVKPLDDGIDDFVWQLNDEGNFVLITDKTRVGGHYIGAVLKRIK